MYEQILTREEAIADIKKINFVLSDILTLGKIEQDTTRTDWPMPVEKDERIARYIDDLMFKYAYGWYLVEQNFTEQVESLIKFQAYLISHVGENIYINRRLMKSF